MTFLPLVIAIIVGIFFFKYKSQANGSPFDAMQYTKYVDVSLYGIGALCFLVLVLAVVVIVLSVESFQNPQTKTNKTNKTTKQNKQNKKVTFKV